MVHRPPGVRSRVCEEDFTSFQGSERRVRLPCSSALRSLCGQDGYVASSRSMPRIQPFLDLERHITFPRGLKPPRHGRGTCPWRQPTSARESIGRSEPVRGPIAEPMAKQAATPWKEDTSLVGFRRTPEPDSLCGVRPVSCSKKQAVAQANATELAWPPRNRKPELAHGSAGPGRE